MTQEAGGGSQAGFLPVCKAAAQRPEGGGPAGESGSEARAEALQKGLFPPSLVGARGRVTCQAGRAGEPTPAPPGEKTPSQHLRPPCPSFSAACAGPQHRPEQAGSRAGRVRGQASTPSPAPPRPEGSGASCRSLRGGGGGGGLLRGSEASPGPGGRVRSEKSECSSKARLRRGPTAGAQAWNEESPGTQAPAKVTASAFQVEAPSRVPTASPRPSGPRVFTGPSPWRPWPPAAGEA